MDREEAEKGELAGRVLIQGNTSPRITILGTDASGKHMVREGLYSGLIFENLVQAIARDLLKNGMFAAEAAGYPIVFSVYDEVVTEVPFGWGDLEGFERLIAELPEWAKTGPLPMPLTASGYRSKRYHK
jgi:DNA polymerase